MAGPWSLTPKAQRAVDKAIAAFDGKCNLLVFGCGDDTKHWAEVNAGGLTVVLEDDPVWILDVPGVTVLLVSYPTRVARWEGEIGKVTSEVLARQLPESYRKMEWDVILVDGPRGGDSLAPGRLASIAYAAERYSSDTRVFVDDCNRPLECAATEKWFQQRKQITKRFWQVAGQVARSEVER